MPIEIVWTRTALKKLPESVREALVRRLTRLQRYFPEMNPTVKVGVTRSYDGLAFQTDEGAVKLMLGVRRKRSGRYQYPTYWTMAHELMHLVQFNRKDVPVGERACDIYALARLPSECIDEPPSYLVVPRAARDRWRPWHARLAHDLARRALRLRREGTRRYIVWWEDEFGRRVAQDTRRRSGR